MEVETSHSYTNQTQDICDNDQNRRFEDAGIPNNEGGLQLDFESEFSNILSCEQPMPSNNNDQVNQPRRSSHSSNANSNQPRLEYNADGTVNCCNINYGTLVSYFMYERLINITYLSAMHHFLT